MDLAPAQESGVRLSAAPPVGVSERAGRGNYA